MSGSRRLHGYALSLVCAAMAGTVGAGTALAAGHAGSGGRTFYVAPNGWDYSRGTSPRHPWRSVGRVDAANLRPGDRVLFKGGAAFAGNTLMPGEGFSASGTAGAPIVFGSYGGGVARLIDGIWLGTNSPDPHGPSYLTFTNLAIGPEQGFQGTGDHITLEHLKITDLIAPASRAENGIMSEGSHWVIADNLIDRVGASGMLLGMNADAPGNPPGGSNYLVYGNVISHTGLDPSLGYPAHGIYLKVANTIITHNWITNFRDDGISVRYHDATITANHIARGQIGIAWYQYDSTAGTSRFTNNVIGYTTSAAIFVCGVAESCQRPIENYVIEHNTLQRPHGARLNLQPTRGGYMVRDNRLQR